MPVNNTEIAFSKVFPNLILKRSFAGTYDYEVGMHDIESIWQCNKTGYLFAYYRSSGLRCITSNLFNAMEKLPDNGKRYTCTFGALREVTNDENDKAIFRS